MSGSIKHLFHKHNVNIVNTRKEETLERLTFIISNIGVMMYSTDSLSKWNGDGEKARGLLHEDCDVGTTVQDKTWAFLHTRVALLTRAYSTTLQVLDLSEFDTFCGLYLYIALFSWLSFIIRTLLQIKGLHWSVLTQRQCKLGFTSIHLNNYICMSVSFCLSGNI